MFESTVFLSLISYLWNANGKCFGKRPSAICDITLEGKPLTSLVFAGLVFSLPSCYLPAHVYHGSTIMHSHKLRGISRYQKPRNKLPTKCLPMLFLPKHMRAVKPPRSLALTSAVSSKSPDTTAPSLQLTALPFYKKQGCHDRIVWQLAIFWQPQGTRVLVTHISRHIRQ